MGYTLVLLLGELCILLHPTTVESLTFRLPIRCGPRHFLLLSIEFLAVSKSVDFLKRIRSATLLCLSSTFLLFV
jgi:hypothetical protein